MFLMISKTAKTVLAVFQKTAKSVFGRFGRFALFEVKSLIIKKNKTAKKTARTDKNISKNGRHGQNPIGFCPLAVECRLFINLGGERKC